MVYYHSGPAGSCLTTPSSDSVPAARHAALCLPVTEAWLPWARRGYDSSGFGIR